MDWSDELMASAELPILDDAYVLDAGTVERFRQDGHTIIRQLATAEEMTAFAPAIERAAAAHNRESRPIDQRRTYGRAFRQTNNLWKRDPSARRFVFARRFASVAAALLGCEAVRLYHDKALVKEPGGGPTPWHQDQFFWPFGTANTVTLWVALRPIDPVPGTLTFASGSHRFGPVSADPTAELSQAEFAQFIDEHALALTSYGAMEAGDASLHAGWTLHRADGNPSSTARPVMSVVYVPEGTLVTEPQNVFHEFERQRWLHGTKPGDLVGGPCNPRLFP